jgi:YVTN family beta-propeller protein
MALRFEGHIELPAHREPGGFDHAAVHHGRRRLYVAHTINDALDVIDLDRQAYAGSIEGLDGVAGALVSEELDLVFSSDRGAGTVSVIDPGSEEIRATIRVGERPNGVAIDPRRRRLLAATVAEPYTLAVVELDAGAVRASIPAPGRTRWAVYDPVADAFFVNIADPPAIVMIDGADPTRIARTIPIPAVGPHGLDVDAEGRLFCASDAGQLLILEPPVYGVVADLPLSGSPDVIFLDRVLDHLYVAIGEPGVIDVFDVRHARHLETVATERGAHTLALDSDQHRVYAFLPATHRAAVYADLA